jgi:hypothetical protein
LGFIICEAHHNSVGHEVRCTQIAFDFIYDAFWQLVALTAVAKRVRETRIVAPVSSTPISSRPFTNPRVAAALGTGKSFQEFAVSRWA